jgi:uncharacterized protein YyaL (SSP411 family)
MAAAEHAAHTNRLAEEESPYLLQHAHNPVDWYPWGEEAFAKAKKENKPIFLSVGYSTCHWCHVMERESFENEAIAKILNEHYVSIKVDREERTDVDRVYMTYVQATSGGGGWPMSVFLTPDLQPFMGGTYFPPKDAFGRPGFTTVLQRISEVWRSKQAMVEEQTADVMRQLEEHTKPQRFQGEISDQTALAALDSCAHMLGRRFDPKQGGFGKAPKFPRPAEINALLHDHLRSDSTDPDRSLNMALFSLRKMAAGGMYDHVGGGFHRYSVDEFWHIPHFEKMMYDNPQLANTYLAAFQVTDDPQYSWVARGVLDYMMRDMTHPEGGIFSAEDADSLDPATNSKKEGAFYLWTEAEIDEVLGPQRAAVFKPHYRVKAHGNADLSQRSDPHDEFRGLNCLIEVQTADQTAAATGKSAEEVRAVLAESRQLLHERRAQRPRPHLDDKVVTAWNGIAISAFANASRILASERAQTEPQFPVDGRPASDYLQAAQKAAHFVRDKLWDPEASRLRRSFRLGPSAAAGYADDYAYLISGLLDLYQANGGVEWLRWAYQLQDAMDELFWDNVGGGYFSTTGEDKSVLLRMKEEYDGAEPAASSIAAANLFRLAALSSSEAGQRYQERGRQTTSAFAGQLEVLAQAMPQMCCAMFVQAASHLRQVVVAGPRGDAATEALIQAAHSVFAPDKVVISIDPTNQQEMDYWKQHNQEAYSMVEGAAEKLQARPAAFVCQNFTCQAPTSDPGKVQELLRQGRTVPAGGGPAGNARLKEVDISSLVK